MRQHWLMGTLEVARLRLFSLLISITGACSSLKLAQIA